MTGRFGTAAMAALVAAALAVHGAEANAQALGVPVAVELRGEVAFPVGDFSDRADTGAGFSVGLSVGIQPGFAVYGSYSDVRFGGGWTGDDSGDARDSGFAVGLSAALDAGAVSPWAAAGLLFHQLEVRGSRQGVSQDMGFEVGGGVTIPLTPQLRLSPTLNYRHYGASIPVLSGLAARDLDVQYLSLGLGLNFSF